MAGGVALVVCLVGRRCGCTIHRVNPSRIGPFKVERELGRGGMGVVYLAEDSRLGRNVAIKALPEHLAADPDRLSRFNREARTLASLNHPNVAQIFGVEEQEGRKYLVLEYVEGLTLADRLEHGPIPLDETLDIATGIAAGLEAAHEAGIVHRDLKPANIKITPEGKIKVLDFGLARTAEPGSSVSGSAAEAASPDSPTMSLPTTPARHSPTMPGAILGTAAYMSPEQARGRRVDRRSDVWAFGVILYECLTGISPFAGETATDSIGAVLHKHLDLALLPPNTPARVRDLIARALERDREKRLRDLGDAMLEIERARLEGPGSALDSTGRRGPGWPAVIAAALVAAAGLGVAAWALMRSPPATVAAPTSTVSSPPQPKVTLRQVTDAAGFEIQPTLSPDGTTVIYSAGTTAGLDIFSLRIGGVNSANLTADAALDDHNPAFSPDGQSIAFRSERDGGGLFVMGATGESPRRITTEGFNPAWSPDGKSIVFASEGIIDPLSRTTLSRLSTVDLATGKIAVICPGDAVQPSWSPSGARIAYWGMRSGGQRDLYTIPAAGGESVAVMDDAPLDWSPAWSPDGKHLYFISDRGGSNDIWRIPIDEATGGTKGPPEAITRAPGTTISFLSIAAQRPRLAFMTGAWTARVMRLDIDLAAGTANNPPRPLVTTTTASFFCSISPDGKSVAYTGGRGGNEDIFIANADGTGRRRLTSDAAKDRGPAWMPDGKSLLFYSDRDGTYHIWSVRTDGSGLSRITSDPDGATNTTLSRDGRWLAYGSRVRKLSVMRLDQSPHEPRVMPMPEGHVAIPFDWSPKGDRLLVGLFTEGQGQTLALLDPETQVYETIAAPVFEADAKFLPDGERLLVATRSGIDVLTLADGARKPLWAPERPLDSVFEINIAPDASWVTFTQPFVEGDVWIADVEEPDAAPR